MCFTLEIAEDAIPILLFVGMLARVDILRAITQQALDQPGEFVGSRRDRLWAAQATAHRR
jgi:hypothetical protein